MTSCIRVLSVQTIDSSPSILVVSPNGKKTIVNCGEGSQRIFLELSQKISTVDRVCLTHIGHDAIGGLPGMILTSADIASNNSNNSKPNSTQQQQKQQRPKEEKQPGTAEQQDQSKLPGLTIVGPVGTNGCIQSLRHFMRRESFVIYIKEGKYKTDSTNNKNGNKKKKPKKDDNNKPNDTSLFVESIVTYQTLTEESLKNEDKHLDKRPRLNEQQEQRRRQVLSFLFTTPPIQGKFLADKAKALGIPPGPLYGKLKSGNSVTFKKEDGTSVTVESQQVVEPGYPGVVTAILYYPSIEVLEQLQTSTEMTQLQEESQKECNNDALTLDLIVHMTPRDLFESTACTAWRESFRTTVRHIFVRTERTCIDHLDDDVDKKSVAGSSLTPFHSASIGSMIRSKLSSDIYLSPLEVAPSECVVQDTTDSAVVEAVPLLEYVLIPRAKRGLQQFNTFVENWNQIKEEAQELLTTSGCLEMARQKFESNTSNDDQTNKAEIIFTGTGSAIPCKHRNVTGIYVRMNNGNAMLLDAGEGTVGQLLRAKQKSSEEGSGNAILQNIKAVWISHPHADHHLGIIRLLAEKKHLSRHGTKDPLILIAPPNLLYFLREYEQVDPDISGTYTFVDCRDLNKSSPSDTQNLSKPTSDAMHRLHQELGITSCITIRVAHCQHSFAVVFHGTSFGSLAYSGDCRPSHIFADIAKNSDVLIHESTFADELKAEAVLKRHSTVAEALDIAKQMQAKTTLLTHFSQRYPRLPKLPPENTHVIPAFDFMRITPSNIDKCSLMTPMLKMLYPEDSGSDNDADGEILTEAQTTLEEPGYFARQNIL